MSSYDIITVGAITQDVFLRSPAFKVRHDRSMVTGQSQSLPLGVKIEVEDMTIASGGGASNAAATFAHQGFRVAFVGKVGNDDTGTFVLQDLHHHGVQTELVRHHPTLPTGYSVILSTPLHGRTILTHRGASSALTNHDIPSNVHAAWWYVTSLGGKSGLLRHVIQTATSKGNMVMINPGWDELKKRKPMMSLLHECAIVMINKEEGNLLVGSKGAGLRSLGRKLSRKLPASILVLTDGENGSLVRAGNDLYSAGAHKNIRAIERTGAGDAFGSGFLSGLLKSKGDVAVALQWGTANSESVIKKTGAKNGLLHGAPKKSSLVEVRKGKVS